MTTISNLTDIKTLEDEDLVETFIKCIDLIFNYGLNDIQQCLLGRPLGTLDCLRKCLVEELAKILPDYANKTMKRRVKDTTLCQDIVQLGYSLVNKTPTKDLDKIFTQPQPTLSAEDETDDSNED